MEKNKSPLGPDHHSLFDRKPSLNQSKDEMDNDSPDIHKGGDKIFFDASPGDPNQQQFETSSHRQKLLVDEDDGYKSFAATMRNPNITKHNILDSLADMHRFTTLKR